jgi:lipoprotein NlpI
MGDLDGAIADFTKAIEFKPDYALAYNNRSIARKAKGDLDGAIADYAKASKLKPDDADAYHEFGCLRYDSHDFTNALADFCKAVELDSSNDYARFRVWLVRARLSEAELATTELRTYLANRSTGKADEWGFQIGRFLAGQLAEPEFLATAKNAGPKTRGSQLCEAYFYAGSKRLLAGDKASAMDYFQKSIDTDERGYLEYTSAMAELKFLKAQKN